MQDPDWPSALDAASNMRYAAIFGKALRSVEKAIDDGDVVTSRWALERLSRVLSSSAKDREVGISVMQTMTMPETEVEELPDDEVVSPRSVNELREARERLLNSTRKR